MTATTTTATATITVEPAPACYGRGYYIGVVRLGRWEHETLDVLGSPLAAEYAARAVAQSLGWTVGHVHRAREAG